jgi:hypothetical protein
MGSFPLAERFFPMNRDVSARLRGERAPFRPMNPPGSARRHTLMPCFVSRSRVGMVTAKNNGRIFPKFLVRGVELSV